MRILVVSLNWRTAEMTLRSVRAALRAMQGLDADLVVVDNDSGDGSFETIRDTVMREGLPVRVIQSGHNGGFGAGNNVGIRAGMADGGAPDLIYLLNSDAFPAVGAIRALADHMAANPHVGCAGSFIHGEDGAAHMTTFRFPSVASEFEGAIRFGPVSRMLARHRVPMAVPDCIQSVDWLAGASMMLRREVLDRTGTFDERYFLYFEETDLCLQIARAGFETHYVPASTVMHIGSVSTGMKKWSRIPTYWLDSRWTYFAKNHGRGYAVAATLAHVMGGLLWRLRRVLQNKPPADPPHFLRDLLQHDLKAAMRPVAGAKTATRRDRHVHV